MSNAVVLAMRRTAPNAASRPVHDGVGDRFDLSRVLARANQEEIGKRGAVPQIQHEDLRCLLVVGGQNTLPQLRRERLQPIAAVMVSVHAKTLPDGAGS